MLEHIFGSKTRLRILNIFFKEPKNKYFVRQLARETNSQLNAVRREIENLLSLGIIIIAKESKESKKDTSSAINEASALERHREGMKKFLAINTDFVLYQELRSLLLKAQLLIEKDFVKRIQGMQNLFLLVLSGIFAARDDAQTDMLLVGAIEKKKLLPIIERFEKELHRNIRYTIMTMAEYKYRRDVTDKFLYDILENKKVVIVDRTQDKAEKEAVKSI